MTSERWQRVKEIFQSGLERAPAERSVFLASACGGDEALLKEVESLIAANEKDGSFIDSPAYEAAADMLSGDQELKAGQTIAAYEIISFISRGGMGEVYLAQDQRLSRKVALKLLPASFANDGDRLRRFEQEARAASALNHPNIVTIHEIGQGDSRHYIATEFIDGETLRARISRTRVEPKEALGIAVQIASALASAHAEGIIHRDIKPENIMLRRDGIVKVLDFGLAKLTEPQSIGSNESDNTLVKTSPGIIMGTVIYMSPEQARGLSVDARTDIWSLGCVLHEMVTGYAAFEGPTPSDTIVNILERHPPGLHTYTQEVPAELERVTAKALAKDREERYQTSRDLLIDLRNLEKKLDIEDEIERTISPDLAGAGSSVKATFGNEAIAPTLASSSVTVESGARDIISIAKGRRAAVLAGLALILIAAVVLGYIYFPHKSAIDSIAVLPFTNASNDPNMEYLSDGVTDGIISSLSQLPQLRVMAQSTVFRYKGKAIDPQRVGRDLNVRALLLGKVVQQGDNLTISTELVNVADGTQLWGGQYDRKVSDLLAVKQEIAQEIAEKLRLRLTGPEQQRLNRGGTNNNEAYQFYLKGRYYWNKRTGENIKKAIEQFQKAIDQDPNFALAHVGLADSYLLLEDYAGARPSDTIPKARKSVERALQIDDSLAEAHTSLGLVYQYQWLWPDAEREYQRAISLDPNYSTAHHWYGNCLRDTGRFDEAAAQTRRAQDIDPLSLVTSSVLAQTALVTGDVKAAIEQSKRALEIDPNYPSAHNYLGMAYLSQGRNAEAIAELQRAVDLSQRAGRRLRALGYAYAVAGQRGEALAILKELEQRYANSEASGQDVAAVYIALGDNDRAFEWLEKDFQAHSGVLAHIRWEPYFNSIRTDARYAGLLRRMGLTP